MIYTAEPEVWFRIVHITLDSQGGAPVATYREQTVEDRPRAQRRFREQQHRHPDATCTRRPGS